MSGSHFQKSRPSSGQTVSKFLRCFDVNGESIYFNLEQKGKFSPVAGEENISGVHTIKNLLRKRMPMTVKMVHGKLPSGVLKNSCNQCNPEMRLLGVVEGECVAAMPLMKDLSHVVTVPMCAGLKLQAPRNNDELRKLREYTRLTERCKWLGQDNADKIHVLDMSSKSKDVINFKQSYSRYGGHGNIHQYFGNIHNQIKKLNGVTVDVNKTKPNPNPKSNFNTAETATVTSRKSTQIGEPNDPRYDEIDVIYDYVRGFGPLPKNISNEFDNVDDPTVRSPKKIINHKPAKPVKIVSKIQNPVPTPKSPKATVNKVPLDKIIESVQSKKVSNVEVTTSGPTSSPMKEEPAPKTSSLPIKAPVVEARKKPEPVVKEDKPPEPPPIETIPVRRSVSMPNATANNILVLKPETNSPQPVQKSLKTNQMNMTDNVAYSNFNKSQSKDNVYDKITHEHEPFTIDLKSPNLTSRARHKKDSVSSNNNLSKSGTKIFIKSQSPNKCQRPRLFKHSFSSPASEEKVIIPAQQHYKRHSKTPKNKKVCQQNAPTKANPTPSPIFNLRYRSLTDLALDFDTLDSSNSGGRISNGSAGSGGTNDILYIRAAEKGSKEDRVRKLPRPKSLTNLVWPVNEADCIYNNNNNDANIKQYNNIISNLFHNNLNNKSSKKCGNSRKLSDGVLIYGGRHGNSINQSQAHRRLSALYL